MTDIYHNNPDFTHDSFLDKELILTQPKDGFRAGSDAVFLASSMKFPKGSHVLDVGCGLGGAGLCAVYKNTDIHVTGIEKQKFYTDLANYNALQNGLEKNFIAKQGDVACIQKLFAPDFFTHIITNPPFYEAGSGRKVQNSGKNIAHQGDDISLEVWLRKSLSVLKNNGIMIIIIRTERLQDIMNALQGRAGDIHILPLMSRAGQDAQRILLKCRKASKAGIKIVSPLILHKEESRDYSDNVHNILSGMSILDW